MDAFDQTKNAAPADPAEPVTVAPDVSQAAEPVQAQSADGPRPIEDNVVEDEDPGYCAN